MAVVQVTITAPTYNTQTPAPGQLTAVGFVDPSVGANVIAWIVLADGTCLDPAGGGLNGANWTYNFNLPATAANTSYVLMARATVFNQLLGQVDSGVDQLKLRS
jgi:hypothetical protein